MPTTNSDDVVNALDHIAELLAQILAALTASQQQTLQDQANQPVPVRQPSNRVADMSDE